jgi:hypothetical protein
MSTRGVYRGIYSALPDDPDFQRLSPHARLVLYTCRLCAQAGPAAIFRYYPQLLSAQTGLPPRHLERALQELETPPLSAPPWIIREGPILWVRNGLRHDPNVKLADHKHRTAIDRAISSLPNLPIVARFCQYYEITSPFQGPPPQGPSKALEALPRPFEGVNRSGSPSMSTNPRRRRKRTPNPNTENQRLQGGRHDTPHASPDPPAADSNFVSPSDRPTPLARLIPHVLPSRNDAIAALSAHTQIAESQLRADAERLRANDPPPSTVNRLPTHKDEPDW